MNAFPSNFQFRNYGSFNDMINSLKNPDGNFGALSFTLPDSQISIGALCNDTYPHSLPILVNSIAQSAFTRNSDANITLRVWSHPLKSFGAFNFKLIQVVVLFGKIVSHITLIR